MSNTLSVVGGFLKADGAVFLFIASHSKFSP